MYELAKGHVAHHRNGLLPFAHLLTDADGSVATHGVGPPAELRHEPQPLQRHRPALGTADGTAAEDHALGMVGIGVGEKICGTAKKWNDFVIKTGKTTKTHTQTHTQDHHKLVV